MYIYTHIPSLIWRVLCHDRLSCSCDLEQRHIELEPLASVPLHDLQSYPLVLSLSRNPEERGGGGGGGGGGIGGRERERGEKEEWERERERRWIS